MNKAKLIEKNFGYDQMAEVPTTYQADSLMFEQFCEFILPRLALPEMSRRVLESFWNPDITAEKIGQLAASNPFYGHQIYKLIDLLTKKPTRPLMESNIVMMGMQNSRNFLVGLQLMKLVAGKQPSWTSEGKLFPPPSDLLKFAILTEEAIKNKKSEAALMAFSSGFIYDLLVMLSLELGMDARKYFPFIDAIYKHGRRTAMVGLEIMECVPEFGLKKFLYPACLMHDTGKIIMSILDPNYLSFYESCLNKQPPRAVRYLAEQQIYGINHALFSSLICQCLKIFEPIHEALLFHHEPFLLRSRNKGLYQLSSIISLSTNIASHFKRVQTMDDPHLKFWRTGELKEFQINWNLLIQKVSKLDL